MFTNTKGMSLVETLIVMGVTSIMALAGASLMIQQQRGIQAISNKVEQTSLMGDLKLILSEPSLCAASMTQVIVGPLETGLKDFCYDGVQPVLNPVSQPSIRPANFVASSLIRDVGGTKLYGGLALKKFCFRWKSTLEQIANPQDKNPGALPQSIRGLGSLLIQGSRDVGGAMREQEILIKVLLEKTLDSDRFNILNKGKDFDLSEPTKELPSKKNMGSIRPVNAAYRVKACSTEAALVPGGGSPNKPNDNTLAFVDVYRAAPLTVSWRPWASGAHQTGHHTKIIFDSKNEDKNSYYNTSNGKLTLPGGLWQITFSSFAYGVVCCNQHLNGVLYKNGQQFVYGPVFRNYAANTGVYLSTIVRSSGTDYFETYLDYGNLQQDITISPGRALFWMQAIRFGD